MDSEDGELFVKQLASFVRTHEKALANALQFQRHRPTQSTSSATVSVPPSPSLPDRPSTSSSTTSSLAAALSFGPLNFTSQNVKSARLALTPHHLFYLLSRFEELNIDVGPMKVRLENLHDSSTSANYVSFLGNTGRSKSMSSDVGSIHSVSSVRSVMSGMSAFWASFGIGASISTARMERQKLALKADLKYLYSAFTKIPCLRLAPDWRARLIRGYEEFPFDSAVPLYAFKNLQALEVSSIDFRQFFGWDRLADQLRSLTLRRAGIEDPADILIDIVMDDMDKRRRRTSKSQASPPGTVVHTSPRRSPTIPQPELHRSATSPDPRGSLGSLTIGSLTLNENAVDDSNLSDGVTRPELIRDDSDDLGTSPMKQSRQRSNSPSRHASRNSVHHARSGHKMRRSGSGSSHSSMSDSWHHHTRAGSTANLLALGVLPASKWRFLRHLSLADNSMTTINPTSLAPLSNTLYSLDLSSNLFSQVPESVATLTALRALNLSQCMIDSLHSLTRNPLPAITSLNLRANRLQSLAGIEKLYPLERLDLRDNRITDPLELARLTGIPDIREIWVERNPFTRTHKDYRITIFNLFRNQPGYTEDIIIDGCGPSYSERRQLVERASIPDSVPVIKPIIPDVPAFDVSKPTILYGTQQDREVLRKERPSPKAIASEINTNSTRRRKTPTKRRIVDLATGETPPSPHALDLRNARVPVSSRNPRLTPESPDHYSVTPSPSADLLPPVVLAVDPKTAGIPRVSESLATPFVYDSGDSKDGQTWDAGGELYRQKIEALRTQVGSGYLTAMDDPSWQATKASSTNHEPRAQHHTAAPQVIHSGRTLG
jgi:hypothetical protein